jgi:hypothetical protein
MVLRLGSTLGVPLHQVNTMLVAAGHDPVFDETTAAVPPPVTRALDLLKSHHEPYPLVVIDRTYSVLDLNRAALAVMGALVDLPPLDRHPDPAGIAALGMNLARLTFDPEGAQPSLVNFEEVGRQLLWRIQREVLADPDDGRLHALLDELLGMPTASPGWRDVDLSVPSEPALLLHLRRGPVELRFLTTVTAFQAPQNLVVEQLRIEHWFPFDDATAIACQRLAGR